VLAGTWQLFGLENRKKNNEFVYFKLKCLLVCSAEGGEGPEEGGQDHQRQPGEGLLEGVQAPTRLLNTRRELSRSNKVGFSHSSIQVLKIFGCHLVSMRR
jgi:hypothetical protein